MWCSVIEKKYKGLVCFSNDPPKAWVAIGSLGMLGIGLQFPRPVCPAALVHGVCPLLEFLEALWLAPTAPHGIALEGCMQVCKYLLHVALQPELLAPLDKGAEIGPAQFARICENEMALAIERRLVRLGECMAALALFELILESGFRVELLGDLGVVTEQCLDLRAESITHHHRRCDLRLRMLAVDLRVSEHITEEKMLGIGVTEVKFKEVAVAWNRFPPSQFLDDGSLNCYQVGFPFAGWDIHLDPIQRFAEFRLIPSFQLFEGGAALLM